MNEPLYCPSSRLVHGNAFCVWSFAYVTARSWARWQVSANRFRRATSEEGVAPKVRVDRPRADSILRTLPTESEIGSKTAAVRSASWRSAPARLASVSRAEARLASLRLAPARFASA